MLSKKPHLMHIALIVLLLAVVFGAIPAYAYDLDKGADDTLNFFKKVVLIVMIVGAIVTFLKHQMVAVVVIVITGSVLLAATSPKVLQDIGEAIIDIVGG